MAESVLARRTWKSWLQSNTVFRQLISIRRGYLRSLTFTAQNDVKVTAGSPFTTPTLPSAAPSSVLTPPAEQPFLPPVDAPAPTPTSMSAVTDLDASLDCRSLDEAEAAQSQILEPPHSSSSLESHDRPSKSAKLRSSSGKEKPQASPLLLLSEPKPATAPAAPLVPQTPPLLQPEPSPPTPCSSPAADSSAASTQLPNSAPEVDRPTSPALPEAEAAAAPPAAAAPSPTPQPAAVSRPPIIDLRLDVEGPPARSGGARRGAAGARRQGPLLARPAAAHGKSSVSLNSSRSGSQLHVQAQAQQLQLFPATLAPVDRPREALSSCLGHLDSHEWEQTLSAMPLLVRLVRHHPDVVLAQLHAVSAALARQVRNLRSQVARAACQAAGELFAGMRRTPDPDVEELVGSLFHRSADTNRFLRADCAAALDRMADALPPARVVQLVVARGASHQNAVVRAAAARVLSALTARLGADRVLTGPRELRDRLLLTGASLLTEGSLDTRCHAKQMFRHLITHPSFGSVISDVVPLHLLRNISKTLQNLK